MSTAQVEALRMDGMHPERHERREKKGRTGKKSERIASDAGSSFSLF
jgi:hypothetical protein